MAEAISKISWISPSGSRSRGDAKRSGLAMQIILLAPVVSVQTRYKRLGLGHVGASVVVASNHERTRKPTGDCARAGCCVRPSLLRSSRPPVSSMLMMAMEERDRMTQYRLWPIWATQRAAAGCFEANGLSAQRAYLVWRQHIRTSCIPGPGC